MAVTFTATDFLDLNNDLTYPTMSTQGTWHCQTHTDDDQQDFSETLDANGDQACESAPYNERNEISASYSYCPNAANKLGTALALILLGDTANGYIITSIAIASSNSGPLQFTFTGHNHDDNAHAGAEAQFTLPAALVTILDTADPLQGVIDWFSKESAGAVGAQSSNLTFSCDHFDVNDGAGDHLAGDNAKGFITASVEYIGPASGDPASPWVRDNKPNTRSNNAGTTSSLTAHQPVTRN